MQRWASVFYSQHIRLTVMQKADQKYIYIYIYMIISAFIFFQAEKDPETL